MSNNKISYHNLNLKIKIPVDTFIFQNETIEVRQYIPAADKYDLVMITLQEAKENGIYNPWKLDVFFHLNLIYMCTNLSFTPKQREDELAIYDNLKSNGFLDDFLKVFDSYEYAELQDLITQIIDAEMKYRNSAAAVLQSIIQDLPRNAEAAQKIVDNFNPSQYQAVVDFAKAANGGRPITGPNKNQEV